MSVGTTTGPIDAFIPSRGALADGATLRLDRLLDAFVRLPGIVTLHDAVRGQAGALHVLLEFALAIFLSETPVGIFADTNIVGDTTLWDIGFRGCLGAFRTGERVASRAGIRVEFALMPALIGSVRFADPVEGCVLVLAGDCFALSRAFPAARARTVFTFAIRSAAAAFVPGVSGKAAFIAGSTRAFRIFRTRLK